MPVLPPNRVLISLMVITHSRLRLPIQQEDLLRARQGRLPAHPEAVCGQGEGHLPQPGAAVARELDARPRGRISCE